VVGELATIVARVSGEGREATLEARGVAVLGPGRRWRS
jgi:hypothetical protein